VASAEEAGSQGAPLDSPATELAQAPRTDAAGRTARSIQARLARSWGRVQFVGTPPERKSRWRVRDVPGCRHDTPPLSEAVIVGDGGLQNVFVHVKSGLEDAALRHRRADPWISIRKVACIRHT